MADLGVHRHCHERLNKGGRLTIQCLSNTLCGLVAALNYREIQEVVRQLVHSLFVLSLLVCFSAKFCKMRIGIVCVCAEHAWCFVRCLMCMCVGNLPAGQAGVGIIGESTDIVHGCEGKEENECEFYAVLTVSKGKLDKN